MRNRLVNDNGEDGDIVKDTEQSAPLIFDNNDDDASTTTTTSNSSSLEEIAARSSLILTLALDLLPRMEKTAIWKQLPLWN